IKGAGAEGRIEETNALGALLPQLPSIGSDLDRQGGRRGELPRAISLGGIPLGVQALLRLQPLLFNFGKGSHVQSPSKSRSLSQSLQRGHNRKRKRSSSRAGSGAGAGLGGGGSGTGAGGAGDAAGGVSAGAEGVAGGIVAGSWAAT